MEELFRFNITRPVERSDAATLPVGSADPLVKNAVEGWPTLEREALKWIIGKTDWILSPEFQQFIIELQVLLDDLLALPSDGLAPSKWPEVIRNRFQKDAKLPNVTQWNGDLS